MPSVMEFDHVMEEHKQRKLADVAEADRQRILAERGRMAQEAFRSTKV